jgi:hypothetical protein
MRLRSLVLALVLAIGSAAAADKPPKPQKIAKPHVKAPKTAKGSKRVVHNKPFKAKRWKPAKAAKHKAAKHKVVKTKKLKA